MPNTKIASFLFFFLMQWLPIQSSPNTFHKHAEITYQEANEEDAVVPSEWYPIKKYMEVYYPSLLWCGEQRQGMGLVIATHWSLVPSTSHFTDYCKIKKEKLTGKARKGVYKVRAPPSLSICHASFTISSSGPFVFNGALNAWLGSKFVAFLLHNLKFKISTLEMIPEYCELCV